MVGANKYGAECEIINEPLESLLNQLTPFITCDLLKQSYSLLISSSAENSSICAGGFFASGKPDGSFLRLMVRVEQNNDVHYDC